MKILYSCLSESWGGMEMITLTFIKELLKKNFIVHFLTIKNSKLHIEAFNSNIKVIPLNIAPFNYLFNLIQISKLISKKKYLLIHTQASKDLWYLVPSLLLLKKNTPLVLTKQIGSYIVKKDFLHNILYNRVSKAFAISSVIKNNLLETTCLSEEKIELVFNGIDTNKFSFDISARKSIRDEFLINDNELLIGMIARFTPGKGHEEFLLAAKILSDKFSNLKFIIVGQASRGEDNYENNIKSLSQHLKLNNVIFTGFRNDTNDILSAMDIFVFPSHAEAFGIALVEAMSCGVPSVCAYADGVLDIAIDGVTSLLFQKKNHFDLANKIELLISNKNLRNNLGFQSRKRAIEYFDLKLIIDKTIQIYYKLINN